MNKRFKQILEINPIETSSPCRIDMGGTLDISTFYYPLMYLSPCTFNMAIGLRTRVKLLPYTKNRVKISSTGFNSVEYPLAEAPFDHPLGLMFAIAAYFRAEGVHILIDSASPPRSALGGSSVAAVALVGAFSKLSGPSELVPPSRQKIALLAQHIETLVAGAPCGLQDQLAAVYGGVNAWYWRPGIRGSVFVKKTIVKKNRHKSIEDCLLLAYCGIPHESLNINDKWRKQFISGKYRGYWEEIVGFTHRFIAALSNNDIRNACHWMNKETEIRRKMTPDVLDDLGDQLVGSAQNCNCGARFSGAGGGGCLWAIGAKKNIKTLKKQWEDILSERDTACLLEAKIDGRGLLYH